MNLFKHYQSTVVVLGSSMAGALTLTMPADAASLAGVYGGLQLFDFSQSSLNNETVALTNTLTISEGGEAVAFSDALAVFANLPDDDAVIETTIISEVTGGDGPFFGAADSFAAASGFFEIEAGKTFSFSFTGFLGMLTGVDYPQRESAFAQGNLGIQLFEVDTTSETATGSFLDGLLISSLLETPGDNDSFFFGSTGAFSFSSAELKREVGGLEEYAFVKFAGTYERTFEETTLLRLENASLEGQAVAQAVPAPSLLWGIMTFGGAGLFKKLRALLPN